MAADEDAKEPAGQAVQLEPTITDPEAGAAGCAAYLPTGHASHVPRDVAAVRARERERERECVCVCVCVCARARARMQHTNRKQVLEQNLWRVTTCH